VADKQGVVCHGSATRARYVNGKALRLCGAHARMIDRQNDPSVRPYDPAEEDAVAPPRPKRAPKPPPTPEEVYAAESRKMGRKIRRHVKKTGDF
jgi:hypothetical protein